MNCFLSVVMPTYNGEKFLAAALDSVRAQWAEDMELVIVDDGSSDRTLDIVREFAKEMPIRLFTPGRLGNWAAISNVGLRQARGEWVCFLHQDDLWLPGRIARLRAAAEQARGAMILHNSVFIGVDGRRLGPWTCPFTEGDWEPAQFIERLLIQNFIAIPAPVFRRGVALESGGLNESLWYTADWDFWLRLAAKGPVRFVDEELCAFRVHPASQTVAREWTEQDCRRQLMAVLDLHFPHWGAGHPRENAVKEVAMASVSVNSMLAFAYRRTFVPPWALVVQLLMLGPSGWHRYMRDSRILERIKPRLAMRRRATPAMPSAAGDAAVRRREDTGTASTAKRMEPEKSRL